MKVVFDANILMVPVQHGVDVFTEAERLLGGCDPIVLSPVVDELRKISKGGDDVSGEDAKAAEVALDMIDQKCGVVEREGYADDVIVEYSKKRDVDAVATNDTKLKQRLYKNNIPVLYLRQRNHLELGHP